MPTSSCRWIVGLVLVVGLLLSCLLLLTSWGFAFTSAELRDRATPSDFAKTDQRATIALTLFSAIQLILTSILTWHTSPYRTWVNGAVRYLGLLLATTVCSAAFAYLVLRFGDEEPIRRLLWITSALVVKISRALVR